MSDPQRPSDLEPGAEGDRIGRLLRWAGPRPVAPSERAGRVRIAVRADWLETVAGRRRRHTIRWAGTVAAAAAATAFLVASPPGWLRRAPEPPAVGAPVGRAAVVQGLVWRLAAPDSTGADKARLQPDDQVAAGDTLESDAGGRMALRLAAGSSLRLDVDSRIRVLSERVFRLERGAVYLDSGLEAGTSSPVEIVTPLGSVFDIGTQFEVRVLPQALRVRVREGAISLASGAERHETVAGTELSLSSAGAVARRSVPTGGPTWDWVLEIAPSFELEGASLDAFLRWVSRETGRDIHFSDGALEEAARGVVLHGSAAGLRPDQALEAVLPTCGLAHTLADGAVLVHTG